MKDSIHIIGGTGKMGTWLAKYLKSYGISVTTSGRVLQNEHIQSANIIFVSVPISKSFEVITNISKIASKNATIVDLSSVMHGAIQAFSKISQKGVSLHYLFGPDTKDLRNQAIVVSDKNSKDIKPFISLFEKDGARIIEMSGSEHDLHMATVQNLTHFVNLAFFNTVSASNNTELSTPTYLAQLSAVNKVLSQDAALLSEIQAQNPRGKIIIDSFLKYASSLLETIQSEDTNKITKKVLSIQKDFKNKREKVAGYTPSNVSSISSGSKVAYLGPELTYSHTAAKETKSKNLLPATSIATVFSLVENGSAEYGVVPAQNTIEGAVRETFDLLSMGDAKTIGALYIPIHHVLASNEKKLSDITIVYSHPQALAQCSQFLATNISAAIQIESRSTVSEIELKKMEKGTGFVTNEAAAKKNNLHILSADIGNNTQNTTRFFIISKNEHMLTGATKTLLFLSVFNRVGILKDILTVFANENINLSNIESRPSREKSWDYHFFVEVDVPYNSSNLKEALIILKQYCTQIKILGALS